MSTSKSSFLPAWERAHAAHRSVVTRVVALRLGVLGAGAAGAIAIARAGSPIFATIALISLALLCVLSAVFVVFVYVAHNRPYYAKVCEHPDRLVWAHRDPKTLNILGGERGQFVTVYDDEDDLCAITVPVSVANELVQALESAGLTVTSSDADRTRTRSRNRHCCLLDKIQPALDAKRSRAARDNAGALAPLLAKLRQRLDDTPPEQLDLISEHLTLIDAFLRSAAHDDSKHAAELVAESTEKMSALLESGAHVPPEA